MADEKSQQQTDEDVEGHVFAEAPEGDKSGKPDANVFAEKDDEEGDDVAGHVFAAKPEDGEGRKDAPSAFI